MIQPFSTTFRSTAIYAIMLIFAVISVSVSGQTVPARAKNNPYSPSPVTNLKGKLLVVEPAQSNNSENVSIMQGPSDPKSIEDQPNRTERTFMSVKNSASWSLSPSETYKIGVGDVLFVNLKNSTQGSRTCTVRSNGTIDFPLAGENLIVVGQTVDDIEEMLASRITLFRDPQLEIDVREYNSHKIIVSGAVDEPGERSLQREAIPLFVIRSETAVNSKATKAVIKRAPLIDLETYDLEQPDTEKVLIYPGNSIEFIAEKFYYIAGEIMSSGKKELTHGLTLFQAVAASGGTKGDPKKAIVRRKDDKGIFTNLEYNLRDIKKGKLVDPTLAVGDVIEIRK